MKILVAIDFSEATATILKAAQTYAEKLDAELFLIHVEPAEPAFVGYEPGPQTVRDQVAKEIKANHVLLHEEAEALKHSGLNVTPLLLQGFAGEIIVAEAERLNADMIIAGSHGHGPVHNILLGSTSEGILHKTKIPVLLVPVKN